MKIYDISLSLSAKTIRWATAQPFELIERKRMSRGDSNNSSSIHTSAHAGTHVDAPFHFVRGWTHDRVVATGIVYRTGAGLRRRYRRPNYRQRYCRIEPGMAKNGFCSRPAIPLCFTSRSMTPLLYRFLWTARKRWWLWAYNSSAWTIFPSHGRTSRFPYIGRSWITGWYCSKA